MKIFLPDDFDLEKTYYQAGPMSGYPEHNWPAFIRVAEALREANVKIIPAHEIKQSEGLDPIIDWHVYLKTDIRTMLRDTQGIIMMRGWPSSQGAFTEFTVATRLKYPAFFVHEHDDDFRTARLIDMNKAA